MLYYICIARRGLCMTRLKTMNIRLTDDHIHKIDIIKGRINADNNSGAIRAAIDLAETITKTLIKGGKVILEDRAGEKYILAVPGIQAEEE
jgi:hypothetical protein